MEAAIKDAADATTEDKEGTGSPSSVVYTVVQHLFSVRSPRTERLSPALLSAAELVIAAPHRSLSWILSADLIISLPPYLQPRLLLCSHLDLTRSSVSLTDRRFPMRDL